MSRVFTRRFVFPSSVLVVLAASSAVAAPPDGGRIRWRSGVQNTAVLPADQLQAQLTALSARADRRHFVVQFTEPVSPARRAELAAKGLTLVRYVADNAWIATATPPAFDAAAVSRVQTLAWAGPLDKNQKLHADLRANRVHDWMVVGKVVQEEAQKEALREGESAPQGERIKQEADPIVGIYVLLHADVHLEPNAARIMHTFGAFIRGYLYTVNGLVLEIAYSKIALLADDDAVEWIEPPLPSMTEVNAENRAITGANIVQAAPYGLNGAGVQVMVYDGGRVRTTHVDFQGRAIVGTGELACTSVSDHSTHVAGTIGGAGVAVANNKGMAPAVDIISYGLNQSGGCSLSQGFLYNDPCDLQADYNAAINTHGADIANNSIGTNTSPNNFPCSWEGDYGVTDTVIDSIVRGSLGAPFRIVWANGNERQGTARCGSAYHTTAPPACAKNHITVGALNANDDSMTSFSSWGPADDDRMKPDVSAPGCQVGGDAGVTSCGSASDTAYTSKCGTSMASPTVCGLSALLLQDYRAQFPTRPDFRNSTLKILLAHTAQDRGNPGPDYQFGYGSVRIQPAVDFMRTGNFLENSVDQGGTYNVLVVVSPSDTQLKITLAWDDPPATPLATPALVNDLDLVVFNPGNSQLFPWTLGGNANPSAPAVRTQANHVDNIEQVFLNAPAPGVYRVEVRGFNVPQGPQPFSLCASPMLVNCSRQGSISLDRVKYQCNSTATIQVIDCDLNANDNVAETVNVTISSTTEPGGKTVTLTETGPQTALFQGIIALSTSPGPTVLQVAHGDTVTATYIDADDGQGGFNIVVTANATVDCQAPIISNVQAINLGPRTATVTLDTDETAKATVRYGTACNALNSSVAGAAFTASHSLNISGLVDNTQYFYAVDAVDQAGNGSTDNNGGSCYSFVTTDIPDFFTEQFETDNDLDNRTIVFVPGHPVDFYTACGFPITQLPTDPTGGTPITVWTGTADDGYTQINLTGGNTVKLYGTSYGSFFVGTNGYITFGSGETIYTESLAAHFAKARVAALFDDLNPGTGGQVSWKQLSDRAVVTWLNVPEYSTTNSNTLQIELYFDGRIQVSYLAVAATDGIAGLSKGLGQDPDFLESDLTSYLACGPMPPSASNVSASAPINVSTNVTLVAGDPNDDPLTYIIATLPAHGTLADPNAGAINSVPYTLVGGGNVVRYKSACDYNGPDSFTYKANDGVSGDSNIATVSVTVVPPFAALFSDTFPTTTFDNTKWVLVDTATIDDVGIGEPSAPYSARFNGTPDGSDEIRSIVLNLSSYSIAQLSYAYEQRGGGESPDAGDDLFIEFFNNVGAWQLVNQHLGSGPDMTSYQTVTVTLPASALHANFQLRIRNTATAGAFDDWFVDDVIISRPNPDPCACAQLGDVNLDGKIDGADAGAFAAVFMNPGGASALAKCASDANPDTIIDLQDVDPFVEVLLNANP